MGAGFWAGAVLVPWAVLYCAGGWEDAEFGDSAIGFGGCWNEGWWLCWSLGCAWAVSLFWGLCAGLGAGLGLDCVLEAGLGAAVCCLGWRLGSVGGLGLLLAGLLDGLRRRLG
jgi:hypothetical protein